ncbi:MAG: peptidoglycan DD-metalloendopeptidase family protein [Pseudomonadales bacterium]
MKFPRTHLVLVALISLGLTSFVIAKFREDDSADRFTTDSVLEEIPEQPLTGPIPESDVSLPLAVEMLPEPEPVPALLEKTRVVRSGDSLARIFASLEIPARELKLLEQTKPHGQRLHDIYPGHTFTFTVNGSNEIIKLNYSPSPLETLAFERAGDGFISRDVQREPELQTAYKHATIDSSLFVASQRAGLDDSLTMRLAQIFQWDIDFVLDIRKGDEFYVLFEERYLDDQFIGYGDILAAEFVNQKQSYRAVRYLDTEGRSGYFNPDGKNMRKAFLRAPVEFSRISSNFNLRRKHPLHNRTMPHRGIDYAAPTGTPILAAGDGRIQTASKTAANGNFVVLQHGEQFVTKYLHLSRFARGVRAGSRVEQGQVIGYVGSTGAATGPHLHYEFLVNGVHMNPRTVKLPDAQPIGSTERLRFSASTTQFFSQLDDYKQQIQLALAR